MAIKDKPNRRVKTADSVFGVIEALDELGEAGVSEVAEHIDRSPSTAHDHLNTLVDMGFLVKEDKMYRLGLRFFELGSHVKRRLKLTGIVKPFLHQMVEETGEIAWFTVEEHNKLVYIDKAEGEYAVQPYGEIGERVDLHNIAAGKAILAYLPEERVRDVIDHSNLRAYTEKTITAEDALYDELDAVQEAGYATNRGEAMKNFRAVASPILHDGTVMGSIVLSGPKKRMQGDRFESEIPQLVTGTANAIELELQRDQM